VRAGQLGSREIGVTLYLYNYVFIKETLLALVRDLFTFSNKVIKRFIIV
jgi:hypothetical protein